MIRACSPVGGGMALRRIVATADVPAMHAQAKVNPSAPDPQAVLATFTRRCHVRHRVKVCAAVGHRTNLAFGR